MRGKRRRSFSILVALSLIFSLIIGSLSCFADAEKLDKQLAAKSNRPAYKDGELLIKFKDGTSGKGKAAFASQNGLKHKKSFDSMNVELYSVKGGSSTTKAIKSLMNNDEIEFIQPNYLYYPAELSNEELSNLWGFKNNVQPEVDIDAPEAWGITAGEADVVVAVIDTGIDVYHPDLSDNMWRNPGEIGVDASGRNKSYNRVDDDGNGYVDDVYGWDFYYNNKTVYDDEYDDEHGTHVAGTIAASANSAGVVGVAPNVKIMSIKFLGSDGGSTADAIDAINYAKQMGAKIINASWGGPSDGAENDRLLKAAVEQSGMLFVAAAGNEGIDIDAEPSYPASFDSDNILTVTAVDSNGVLADFSNYGAVSADVGAPGVGIYSTVPAVGEGIAAVGVSGEYNAFVAAFGLEDLKTQQEADDLLSGALDGIATDAPILLVDDDGNGTYRESLVYENVYGVYDTALANLGYTNVDVMQVESDISDGPNQWQMGSYDAVIWFTGETFGWDDESTGDWAATLTEQDQLNLKSYLESGKKLILFGQDALFYIEDSELLYNYLDIEVAYPDYGKNQYLVGADSTVFESVYYDILSGSGYERDYLEPIEGSAKALLYYPEEPEAYYGYMNGTSMATPYVTGIGALLLSKNPDLGAEELKQAIISSGTSLGSLDGYTSSGNMANAFNALKKVAPANPAKLAASKSGSNITLNWTGREAGDFKEYIVERRIDNSSYSVIGNTTGKNYTDSGIDVSKTYEYRVKAVDDYSNESGYSNTVIGNVAVSDSGGGNGNGGSGQGGGGGGGGGGSAAASTSGDSYLSIDAKVMAALNSASTKENVSLPMIKYNGIESAVMGLKTAEALSKSGKLLTLIGSGTELKIPASALMTEEVKKYFGNNTAKLNISVNEIKGEEAQKLTGDLAEDAIMIGDRAFDFTIKLETDKETINIRKFGEALKLSIKLSAADIAGADMNKLGVYYYNTDKKIWEYVGGIFEADKNTMNFDTDHFSKYAVILMRKSYGDIANHWAKSEIELMTSRHISEGISDKEFGPDKEITRAELIKMLVNLLRYNSDRNIDLITPKDATYKDVSTDNPYFSFIETAAKLGITNGNVDGTFRPNDTVTREQLTTMIIRAMGIETDSDMSAVPFTDKEKIPGWAAKSIIAAYERGLVLGVGGNKFGVGSTATRAQATVIIKRVMGRNGLFRMPSKINGKLTINSIEGQHYELETKDGVYVLQYDTDNKYIAKVLSRMVGKELEVSGYEEKVFTIYQRGKVFKVISIELN